MSKKMNFYNIPIVDYLVMIGEPIEKLSANYYQHKDHDSLKINVRKNYFVWNSRIGQENHTGGVLQYLQIMHSLSLSEAMQKIQVDLTGKDLKEFKPKNQYPKYFNYRVKETSVPIEAQKYLVSQRKIPNVIIKHFFSLDLISQNKNKEIIFKWYKGDKVVGFDKQGTKKLTKEQKEKYNYKKDYIKYVSPTTEKNTLWGFNYLVGNPENIYFFESPIDLISYYAIYEEQLNNKGNFWLVSINGVAINKVHSFIKYAYENLNLKEHINKLYVCFDNDTAGKEAWKQLEAIKVLDNKFEKNLPNIAKDWNDVLKKQKENASYDK